MLLLLIHDLKDPEMLAKTVAVDGHDSTGFLKGEPFAAALTHDLSAKQIRSLGCAGGFLTRTTDIKRLRLFRSNVRDL